MIDDDAICILLSTVIKHHGDSTRALPLILCVAALSPPANELPEFSSSHTKSAVPNTAAESTPAFPVRPVIVPPNDRRLHQSEVLACLDILYRCRNVEVIGPANLEMVDG